jgi:hypothetical protein
MPMDYASQASAMPTSGTTVVVSKPAGTIDGDVLVAMISVRAASAPAITAPSGWTQVGTTASTGSNTRTGVYTKVAGASEPANYTWTIDVTIVDAVGAIARYTPAAPTTAPGAVDVSAQGTQQSPAVAPDVTATGNNDRLICLFSAATAGSTPTGMTQRVAIDGGFSGAWIYDELRTVVGATGTRTWTGSATGFGWSVALLGNQQGSMIRMMI